MTSGAVAFVRRASLALLCLPATSLTGCTGDISAAQDLDVLASDRRDPDYLVFEKREEALEWFESFKPTLALQGTVPGAILAENDARTKRIDDIIGRSWDSVRSRFAPRIPKPRVIVFEATAPNAFIAFNPNAQKIPNAVLVQTPILDVPDLEGTLAHELGHLVLKHGIPENAHAVERYYRVSGSEPLGLTQRDDADVRAVLEGYLADARVVGPYPAMELNGVPISGLPAGMPAFLQAYMSAHADPATPSCVNAATDYAAAHGIAASGVRVSDLAFVLSEPQRAELDALTKRIGPAARECLPSSPDPLVTVIARTLGLPEDAITKDLRSEDLAAIAGLPTVEAVVVLTQHIHARMRTTSSAPAFGSYRVYTTEEQADEFAMTVLHTGGQDPLAIGREVMALQSPADQAACTGAIQRGEVPNYGIADHHHSSCYRLYHAHEFAKHLAAGGEGITRAHVPAPRARGARRP